MHLLNCEGKDSCTALNDTIRFLINETFSVWDTAYGFDLYLSTTTEEPFISYSNHSCTRETVGRRPPGYFPIPLYPMPDNAYIELGICKT